LRYAVMDEDQRLGSVRDRLLDRYLGFAAAGMHFELRDISAEIAEARRMMSEFLGRELVLPNRPSRLIHLWVVTDDTAEIVGRAAREVGLRGTALVVAHKKLHIQEPWRRRGFGSALLAENRVWYRESDVEFIVMEAEGDGSAFAATRGFDFDLAAYAGRPGLDGLDEQGLRFAAVDRLIRHGPVQDIMDDGSLQPRATVLSLLERLRGLGPEPSRQALAFERRLPQPEGRGAGGLVGDQRTFTAPHEIAAFGRDEPLDALDGSPLGRAVLAVTGWSGVSVP
jgi:GNAT superfamily N-acetyltransferase